ncbi:7TM GPCR, serpentine receptor class r (Str) family-containing protein [Aphelenchoides besseyi]|nr:7TM GPCR, serpentine receptor class r (Str) family-containing protein [Aphelenchoides besseyi]
METCVYMAEGTSFILNTIVIYLALTETNKDIKEYKNLLVLNCIVDYVYTLIGLFNHDTFEITQNVWIHILGWPANLFPKPWHYVFVGAFSFKLSFGIISLPIQFGYRWCLLCRRKMLTVTQLILIFVATFIISCHWWTVFGLAFYISDHKYVDHSFLMSNPFIFNDQSPDPTLVITELKNPLLLEITLTALVANGLTCFLIGYFTYKTIKKLEESKGKMSNKTRRLQNQMTRILLVQTTSVLLTAIIPIMIMGFMVFTAVEIHGMGSTMNVILSWIPVLNPFCTIIMVRRLRLRLLSCISPFSYVSSNTETSRSPIYGAQIPIFIL